MKYKMFITSLIIIGLLLLCFSSVVDVNAGFPVKYFGYRYNQEDLQQNAEGLQVWGKFQYNGSYGGRPDNISIMINLVCTALNPFTLSCGLYDNSLNKKATTENKQFTSSSLDTWIKFTVNYTTNTTPLVPSAYYYIGVWCNSQGGITTAYQKYSDIYGSQLGLYTRSDTGYFSWDSSLGSVSTVDADATMSIFCNYTEIANPEPPNTFVVTNVYGSDTSLSMSWIKGTYATKTTILMKTGSNPTTISDGTVIYNDTGTSYTKTSLTTNIIYFFSAWSWSDTFHTYSLTYVSGNKRVYVKPVKPTDFIGNNVSYTRNLFAWVKGINATVTRIQYNINTTYPSTVSTGTNTYNSTNTYNDDSGLLKNSSYYYSAWSFNSTNGLWSSDYATLKINTNDTIYGSIEECDNSSLTIYNNTVNTTGKYETSYNSLTGWKIWLNFTGLNNECPNQYLIYLYENILNATGTHEYILNETGYIVYANYTGNITISEGNITEEDLTISIFSVITFGGIGVLMIRRRKRNES